VRGSGAEQSAAGEYFPAAESRRSARAVPWSMAEFKLSLGLEKLIEVIAQGIGGLAKPWMMRRLAAAEADRMKILAGADKEIAAQHLQLPAGRGEATDAESQDAVALDIKAQTQETSLDPVELFGKRVEQRIATREARRQRNIETVVMQAASKVAGAGDVSREPVDEDWVARFFSNVQEVSDEKLQRLWSSLLAHEVMKPGTVSLRTLEVLRNLAPAEAEAFQDALRSVCSGEGGFFFFIATREIPLNRYDMVDCGLLSAGAFIEIPSGECREYEHAGLRLKMLARDASPLKGWQIVAVNLTRAGQEIANIAWRPADPNRGLLDGIIDRYSKHFIIDVFCSGAWQPLSRFLGR